MLLPCLLGLNSACKDQSLYINANTSLYHMYTVGTMGKLVTACEHEIGEVGSENKGMWVGAVLGN